ncbi:MAG: glycosyltransferase family 4 protein [Verrucomicrobiales bacterium]
MADGPHIAYLYSRYPVVSQTFCDSEMLALERLGVRLSVASLNPPPTSFRHERLQQLEAEIHYPPPSAVLKGIDIPPAMQELADDHAKRYPGFKIQRARNAAYFARLFAKIGIGHVHVHFANQATWTALFLKKAGFRFSFTAHAQDFMVDLGSDDLLREMAAEAEFVIAVSDYSQGLLRELCSESTGKIHRVYNGIELNDYSLARRERLHPPAGRRSPLRIISIGRLIEFKGFHHLIEGVALLGESGLEAELQIIGEGPWRERLEKLITTLGVSSHVRLRGVLDNHQVRAELAASDVFALACCMDEKGATDVLPTVIAEAMAAGLPVVSTRLAGVPEMVEHEKTGLLVDPAQPELLANALAKLAGDPEWCAQLGQAGRDKCEMTFSLGRTVPGLKTFLDQRVSSASSANKARDTLILYGGEMEPYELIPWLMTNVETTREYPILAANLPSGGVIGGRFERGCPEGIEFLPHAIVLESMWKANRTEREGLEALSARFHTLLTEDFFRDARRAIYAAGVVRKRHIRHVHAWNDSTMLWAWLVKKLTGCAISFTTGDRLLLPVAVSAHLAQDFDFGNAGHAELRRMADGRFEDELGLEWKPQARIALGRLRIGTRRHAWRDIDFDAWLRRNLSSHGKPTQGPGERSEPKGRI